MKNNSKKRSKKAGARRRKFIFALCIAAAIIVSVIIILRFTVFNDDTVEVTVKYSVAAGTEGTEESKEISISIQEDFLTPNEYSRPQTPLTQVNAIVVHYTSNPGTTAAQNRSYFESLKDGEEGTYASSHFVIGIDGEIIQCIPLDEVAYASNERNDDSISIECCHDDESGEFTEETYQSLVELTAYLCQQYNLSSDDVIRHYDVTGKECPKYFVDNPDAWTAFKGDVANFLETGVHTFH